MVVQHNSLFLRSLLSQAQQHLQTIALPEGEDIRMIKAAAYCVEQQIARCMLYGKKKNIMIKAKQHGFVVPSELMIKEMSKKPEPVMVESLLSLRKHKGLSLPQAQEALSDPIVASLMCLYHQQVDGVVAGVATSTQQVLRPALQIIKTVLNQRLSSAFFMCLPEQLLMYADCAINISPNAGELASIAIQTATTAKQFGLEPNVALLSYSTYDSGQGELVDKIKLACRLIQDRAPNLLVDGPLQYDAAVDMSVARIKAPHSRVAGKANIMIFPDLNAANISYKAVQRSTGCVCLGPVLQGLSQPVNDLSRGASVEDIIATIAVTAIQATASKNKIVLEEFLYCNNDSV